MTQEISVGTLPRAPTIASHQPTPKPDMTAEEARDCVQKINGKVSHVRALLLDLYERKGWKALGYASWRECAAAEFGKSATHLYRQLQAAEVEREISPMGEIGDIPERNIREIKETDRHRFIRQSKEALASKDPRKIKQAVRDFARQRREEKKQPDLTPRRTPLGDAAPDGMVTTDPDSDFDGLVAEERRAAILASKKAREYPVSCPCGCGVWSFKSPPPPSRFIPTARRG